MLCKTNIYVLKYIFVVYKKYKLGKISIVSISYFLNRRVTVSLTMLIRLSHKYIDVYSFLQKVKAAVFARQPQDSREVAVQTCKTVKRQFHINCEPFSRHGMIIGLRYECLMMFVSSSCVSSSIFKHFFPMSINICFGHSKKRLMKNALSIHNILCRFGCLEFIAVYLSTNNMFSLENKTTFDNALIQEQEQKKTQLLPIYLNLNRSEVLKTSQFWFFLLIVLSLHGIPFLCGGIAFSV